MFVRVRKRSRARWSRPLQFSVLALLLLAEVRAEDAGATFRIEPSIDEVPANHLKFYLHFSEPMERGRVFRYLKLLEIDEQGKAMSEVPEPFREVELWDEAFTRMTLWFHPGRQKPGVNLNVEIGPILEDGKRYRLEISRDWKTERSSRLEGPLEKVFTAGEIDNEQPDPGRWGSGYRVDSKGRIEMLIGTREVLDPESASRRIEIFQGEKKISFVVENYQISFPCQENPESSFRVVVDPRLEDLAGNSVARPFNLDLNEHPNFEERTKPVELSFPRKIVIPEGAEFPGLPTGKGKE